MIKKQLLQKKKKKTENKTKTNSRLECKNRHPIYYQNGSKIAKIDILFMTKAAEKPLGAAHTYIAHIRECPPGCRLRSAEASFALERRQKRAWSEWNNKERGGRWEEDKDLKGHAKNIIEVEWFKGDSRNILKSMKCHVSTMITVE